VERGWLHRNSETHEERATLILATLICATWRTQVVIRVRPPLPRELYGEKQFQNMVAMDSAQQLTVSENLAALQSYRSSGQGDRDGVPPPGLYATHQFTFDHVHGPKASQVRRRAHLQGGLQRLFGQHVPISEVASVATQQALKEPYPAAVGFSKG